MGLTALALVGSCVTGDEPTGVGARLPAGVVLQPALIPSAANAGARPIDRIRAVTVRVPDNVALTDTTFTVNPGASSWSLDIPVSLPTSPTRALAYLYLMNAGSGPVPTVEFSGRTDTLTLVSGETTSPGDFPIVRGPIGNLSVTGVTITSGSTVVAGRTLALTASVPTSVPGATPRVYWTSLDTAVARVDSASAIGVAPGMTSLIASAGAFADTTALTVILAPVDSVEVSPSTANVIVGQTRVYTARLLDDLGGVLSGRVVRWSTTNVAVATVDSITGVVTAVALGTTSVRATSEGVFDEAAVVVVPVPVRSVRVSPDSADVTVGGTQSYSVQTFDSIGGVLTGRSVTWTTGSTAVATVGAASGVVTGVSAGTTTVRATSEGVFDDAVVRVTGAAPSPALNRWLSAVSGSWSNAANWSKGTVPVAGDSVVIDAPGSYTVTLDAPSTIAHLLLGGAGGAPTLAVTSGATLTIGASGTIAANGVLELADGTLAGSGVVTSSGTLRKTSGTGTSTVSAHFRNDGTVSTTQGVLHFSQGSVHTGPFTVGSGALLRFTDADSLRMQGSISGAGVLEFAGTVNALVTMNASVSVGGLRMTGGVATTNATLAVADSLRIVSGRISPMLTATIQVPLVVVEQNTASWSGRASLEVTDSLHLTGGFFSVSVAGGFVRTAPGVPAVFANGVGPRFQTTMRLQGPSVWTGGDISLQANGRLEVASGGSLDIRGNDAIADFSASGAAVIIEAGGVVTKSVATGTTIVELPLTNQGTLEIRTGTLRPESGFAHDFGAILSGAGTLNLSAATSVTMSGDIRPGTSPGILSITPPAGGVTLGSQGDLSIELNGLSAGTGYDRLAVSGPLTLGGDLVVVDTTAFNATAGDRFAILTTTSRAGNFASVILPSMPGVALDTVWSTAGTVDTLFVQATSAAPAALNRWQNAVSGNWNTAANWSRNVVPEVGDSVVIDVPGTYTVTLDVSDTISSLSLGSASGTQTLVSGGPTLRLNGPGVVTASGVLSLSNASLTGAGTLTNQGTFIVQGSSVATGIANAGLLRLRGLTPISGLLTTTSSSVVRVEADGFFSGANAIVSNGFTNNGLIELTSVNAAAAAQLGVGGTLVNADSIVSAVGAGGTRTLNAVVSNQAAGGLIVAQPLSWGGVAGASTNAGTIDVAGGDLLHSMQASASLTNTGTITIGAGRTYTFASGTLNYAGGSITGGGTLSFLAAIANLTTSLSNATTRLLITNTVVNGPGTLTNEAGDTLVVQSATIAAPLANSGLLRLRGANTISGAVTTTSTSAIRVEGDGTFSSASSTISSGFTNNGLIELTTVTASTSADLIVNGTLTNTDSLVSRAGVGGGRLVTATLVNQGTLLVSQGLTLNGGNSASSSSGTVDVSGGDLQISMGGAGTFTNTGTVTIASNRTLTLVSGTFNQSSGSLGGPGTLFLNGTTANFTTSFSNATTRLGLLSATFSGPGTLTNAAGDTIVAVSSTIAAPLANQGLLRLRGTNNISGALTTTATSAIRVEGDGTFSAATTTIANSFTNNGLVELTSVSAATSAGLTVSGTLTNADSIVSRAGVGGTRALTTTLVNQGTLLVSQGLSVSTGGSASSTSGVVDVSGGDLAWSMSGGGSVTNTGTVTVGLDRTWTVTGGALNQSAGSIGGAGTLSLSSTTANLTTPFSNATTRLILSSAIVNGPGTLTNAAGDTIVSTSSTIAAPFVNEGLLRLRATNTISGTLTTAATSTIRVEGDGTFSAASSTIVSDFTNNGLIELTSVTSPTSADLTVSGTLTNADSIVSRAGVGGTRALTTTLVNQGTLLVSQGLTLSIGGGVSSSSALMNVTDGDLTLSMSGGSFTNTGTVIIGVGRTWTVSGGTLNQSAGSIGGAGTLFLNSTTANFTTAFSNAATRLSLSSATFNGPGTLTNAAGDTIVATYGTIAAPLVNEGLLRLRATNSITGTLTTASTSNIRVEGDGTFSAAATTVSNSFTNDGTIELTAVNAGTSSGFYLSAGTLTNASTGSIVSTAGVGGPRFLGIGATTLVNQGTLRVDHPLTVSGTFTHADGALLEGSSSVDLSGATLGAFDGDVAPGSSPGILSITGGYAPTAASTFRVEVNGATAGTGHDRLDVSGATTLNGALVVLDTTAFVPTGGDRYAILTASSISGNFASVTLPANFDTVSATAGSVDTMFVRVLGAAPVNRWISPGSGNWGVAANWSLNRVPLATDSVVVDASGTYEITMDVSGSAQSIDVGAASGTQTLVIPATRTLTLGSVATSTVDPTGRILLSGTLAPGSGSLASSGIVTINGGTLAPALANSGTLIASGTSSITGALSTTSTSIIRVGQIDGLVGTATLTIANGFTNSGAIEITNAFAQMYSSVLNVSSGTLTNAPGATISTLAGTLGGGNRTLNARLDNQGTVTTGVSHPLIWTGPSGAAHTNSGTIDVAASGALLTMTGGASLTNTGTISMSSIGPMTITGGTFTHSAGATLTAPTGGLVLIGNATAVLDGTFSMQAISAQSSTITIASGVSTADLTLLLTSSTVNGTGSITNDIAETLTLIGSTIQVPVDNAGTIIASGTSTISGTLTSQPNSSISIGQVDGSVSLAHLTVANGFTNNGSIVLTNNWPSVAYSSRLTVTAGTLVNAALGTISTSSGASGGGQRTLSARLENAGIVDPAAGHPLTWIAPSGAQHTNTGTFVLDDAGIALTLAGGGASLTNSGEIDVGPGTSLSIAGGTFTHQSGGLILGSGALSLSGGAVATLGDSITVGTLALDVATVALQGGNLSTNVTALSVVSATINGPDTLVNPAGETTTLNSMTIGAPLVNRGTLVFSGASTVTGALTAASGSTMRIGQIDGSVGTALLSVASGFTNDGAIELTNQGPAAYNATLNVTSGTLVNAGTITTLGGLNPGGARTLGGTIDNQGTLAVVPGGAGVLSIVGSLTSSGTIEIELGGLTAGTQYDRIDVSSLPGSAALGGTLNVSTFGGFLPAIGNAFTPITYGSRTGAFTTTNLPGLLLGQWSIGNNATTYTLSVIP